MFSKRHLHLMPILRWMKPEWIIAEACPNKRTGNKLSECWTTAHISLMLRVVLALRLSKGYSNKAVSRISSRVVNRHNINIPPKHKTCQVIRNPILYFIYLSFHCSSLRCFLAGTSRLCCSQGIEIKTEVSVGMPQNLLIRYIHLSSGHPSLSFLCRHNASHRSTTERKHENRGQIWSQGHGRDQHHCRFLQTLH